MQCGITATLVLCCCMLSAVTQRRVESGWTGPALSAGGRHGTSRGRTYFPCKSRTMPTRPGSRPRAIAGSWRKSLRKSLRAMRAVEQRQLSEIAARLEGLHAAIGCTHLSASVQDDVEGITARPGANDGPTADVLSQLGEPGHAPQVTL